MALLHSVAAVASRRSASLSSTTRSLSTWEAVKASMPSPSSLLSSDPPPISSTVPKTADPLQLLKTELATLRSNVSHLLGSGHPSLDTVAKYYFQAEGKHIRPTIVLLMSQATNGLGRGFETMRARDEKALNDPLTSRLDVLNDFNPGMPESTQSFQNVFVPSLRSPSSQSTPPPAPAPIAPFTPALVTPSYLLPTQRRLAEIVEMIHVASLLHDDVIDVSPTRRGAPSAPALFGNKVSILAGDFLLGRASGSLARLGSSEVVELMSAVIANLVEGEVMQLKATTEPERRPTKDGFDAYMQKTYLKTASLMAKGSRSAVVLGGCEDEGIKDAAYAYGRNLGIAFQLVDDLLDFTPTPSLTLGKPSAGFDLSLGLATAPLLYAWESNPSLTPLILRRFDQPGDVETARDLVLASDGMDRTRALARTYAEAARDIVRERLPESDARAGLEGLTEEVLRRLK